MPITINHELTATTPDNTSYEIRPSHWNSTHAATVSLVGSEIIGAFSNANNVSFGTNAQGAVTASASNAGGVGISAGANFQSTGFVEFLNSNNISFGMDNQGNLTGSVGPSGIVVSAGNAASNISSIVFSNSNGVSFGLNGSTLTASYTVPPTGISVAANGVTENLPSVVFSNSNGLAFGLNGSTITGSYTVPSTAGLLSAIALSAGAGSTLVSGISFSNSNGVSFGEANGTVTASVNVLQTVYAVSNTTQGTSGTQNNNAISYVGAGVISVGISNGSVVISGNASGSNPAIGAVSAGGSSQSTGTIVFSNSNGVSFGLGAGGVLTATVNPGPAAGIGAIAASNTSQTTGSLIFSNSNGISFGLSSGAGAGTLTASFSQTVQTQNVFEATLAGNTSGTLAIISSGILTLAGGNNVTLSQVGNAVTISGASQGPTQTGISGIQVSNNTYTSGTLTFQNANGISFGSSGVNGISASYTVPSTAGLISAINVSAGGVASNLDTLVFSNSNGVSFGLNGGTITGSIVGTVGSISAGTTNASLGQIVFSNSNSVSFGMNGGTITASVSAPLNISAGTQAVVGTGFTFSNSNGVSFGMNNGTITASISTSPTVGGVSAIQAGTQIQTSGGITFSNSNGVGFGLNAGVLTESIGVNVFGGGNTTQNSSASYNVSALSLFGGGAVSVGNSNGSIVFSAPNTVAHLSAGVSTGGNTLGTTGIATNQLVFAGGANITLSGSTNAGSMTISVVGAAGGTGGASTVGGYAVGNTTQSSQGTLTNSILSFSGAGIISVGYSNGAVIISGPASSGLSQSLYVTGNTTQSSSGTQSIGSLLFQGAGNVSVGVSNGSVVISGAGGGGGGVGFGVSTAGNTAGATGTVTTGNVVLVGSGPITLSQATGAAGSAATITIFGPATSQISGTGQVSVVVNANTISIGVPSLSLYGTSNTTQSSSGVAPNGSLLFAGAGNVSVGVSNSSVVISGIGGGAGVSIGGNSTSAGAGYSYVSSGTALFAGGNNITLSQNGASITISGANAGGAQTAISGLAVSNTTYTSGTVTFQNANGISFGSSGANGISASYTVPVVATTAAYYFGGNTTGQSSSSTAADQTLSISAAGIISGGWSAGSIVLSATVPAQTNQTESYVAIGNTTGNTSGLTVNALSHTLSGAGIVSVGYSTSAGGSSIIISASQSNQAISAQGGSSGFQTLIFTNSNNVSFSNTGGSIWGSYALNVSAPGGTSNALSAITFSNSNGVSFGLSTGVGVGTLTASIVAQTNQTLSFAANGNTTGNTSGMSVDARSLSLGGFGGASVGYSTSVGGSTVLISAPASSSLSATGQASVFLNGATWSIGVPTAIALSIGGNSTSAGGGYSNVTSGTAILLGGNNITLSQNGASITISAASQSNQAEGGYAVGNTIAGQSTSSTFDARTQSTYGSGIVSVGISNGSAVIYASQSNQNVSFFGTGNTTQNSSTVLNASALTFNGLGAQTVGFSNGSVQLSVPATSSIVGTNGISISVNASTISLSLIGTTNNYFEPSMRGQTTSAANAQGTVYFVPFDVQQNVSALRLQMFQQVTTQPQTTMSISASVSAGNVSNATGGWSMLGTVGLYSRVSTGTAANSSQIISFFSNTYSYGMGLSNSVSWSTNASSATASFTTSGAITYIASINSNGVASTASFGTSGSSTFSSTSAGANSFSSSFAMTFASNVLSGVIPIFVPFGTSLSPGEYFLGHIQSSASASTNQALQGVLSVAPAMVYYSTNTAGYRELGATVTNASSNFRQGMGSYNGSANSTTTIALTAISNQSQFQLWFNMNNATK